MKNKRSIRTKKIIRETFLESLKMKSVEKISVTALCKQCELNRTTFYLHYTDVYAILEEIQEEILVTLTNMSEDIQLNHMDDHQIICLFLDKIKQNQEFLKIMLLACSEEFWNHVKRNVYLLFLNQIIIRYPKLQLSKQELEDIIRFLNNGYWETYREWLLNGCKQEMDYIADYLLAVSNNCMKGL